ncbi:cellulose synthase subunit BcsC-related outer membrane protein [Brenneria populi subsp. brevivirga]|uniref:cellulose biosynthesis protein BcsC n=1 Tax=Brenneria populi TaxID=1505588 RepID=UPI002E19BFFE|nr:cellulose synthase subunit BcsC-related outer membrane protein [Brenneria populi subsp. brevivirga]
MMKMKRKMGWRARCLTMAGIVMLPVAVSAAENGQAIKALLDQAAYWHEKAHGDLANEALRKILEVEPKNTEALYLLALYAQQNGDAAAAQSWRQKLVALSPGDSRLDELDRARALTSIPPAQLARARQLAAQGNLAGAVNSYRALFKGEQPLDSLAVEYYQTLAGLPASRTEAISGLQRWLSAHPGDRSVQLALARILTYDETTRREGVNRLAALAAQNVAGADPALKQALLWMTPQAGDEPLYRDYQRRNPGDREVPAHYERHLSGIGLGQAYAALQRGDLRSAKSQFDALLAQKPQDADALAGLGFIALRNEDFIGAENYLNQAINIGGANRERWVELAQDARFYAELNKAKMTAAGGSLDEALALSEPLERQSGERGIAARLFSADLLRRKGDAAAAEQRYRDILTASAGNNDARLGLYYSLQQQKKTAEAQQVWQSLPDNLRPQSAAGAVSVEPLRRDAALAMQSGSAERALALLQQARQRQPDNPWVRLDMARILQRQGNDAQAEGVIASLGQPGAAGESLYVAALFAAENQRWAEAGALMERVAPARRTREMAALARRVQFNQNMTQARAYLAQGNRAAAAALLNELAQTPPDAPADLGNLALALQQAGDSAGAVQLVRRNMQNGVQGSVGDYAAQLNVLNQAGLSAEADAWLNNPAIQSRSSPVDISRLRTGSTINEADRLREQGQYALAYDKLIVALQQDPRNDDLMLAMGRLYQSGKMNREAGQVYDYLLQRDAQNQQAREGAVNVALANNDVARAKTLMAGMTGERTPERLLLAARVAQAQGDRQQALALLRSAKGKMIGLQGADGSATIAGLPITDNPFINQQSRTGRSPSAYGMVLPWQLSQRQADNRYDLNAGATPAAADSAQDATLRQVDRLLDEVQGREANWAQGNVSVRGRDGENGLSELTEAKAPLTLSGVPFDTSRLSFSVTPVTLNAGTPTGTTSNRFGTGALQQAEIAEAATAASAEAATKSAQEAVEADTTYQTLKSTQDTLCAVSSTSADCLAATSAASEAYIAKQLADSNVTTAQTFGPNDFNAGSPGAQKANGVELNLALAGDSYKADIGTTPLGQDMSSLVGGAQWSPKLSDYTTLTLNAERRPVTDSLLSYVGAYDKYKGKKWGAVTRNGGSVNLGYDNGDAGFYTGLGYYSYLGDNVASNKGLTTSSGVYIRPYRYDDRELKLGVNVSYMDFSKNLSYFSYGQGGYFSPQDYISVSFPVEYSQQYDSWSYKLGGSVGYQSYSQKESAYFPNNADLQSELEALVAAGYGSEAWYAGKSQSGIGYNLKAEGSYKLNKNMIIGGQAGYDTFGDYSESTALVYFRYLLDGK